MQFGTILPFLAFLLETAFVRRIFKAPFAWALPFSACLAVCVLYASGLVERLHFGLCALLLLSAAGLIWEIIALVRRSGPRRIPAGLIFVAAVFVFAVLVHRRETIIGWDEGAHWALTIKNSFALNRFGASRYSNLLSSYKTYLPGAAMFEYYFTKLNGAYSNAAARVGLCVMTASFLAPALSVFDCKERVLPLRRLTVGIILFFVPFAFFRHAFNSLTVDCILGLALSYAILSAILLDGSFGYLSCGIAIITVGLIKESGFLLGLIAAVAVCACLYVRRREAGTAEAFPRGAFYAGLVLLLLLPFLTKLSWALYLSRQGIDFLRALFGLKTRTSAFGPYTDYGVEGWKNFYRALLYNANFSDDTKFYVSLATVPYSVWLLIVSALFFAVRKLTRGGGGVRRMPRSPCCLSEISSGFSARPIST